jgi:hypothetical protein
MLFSALQSCLPAQREKTKPEDTVSVSAVKQQSIKAIQLQPDSLRLKDTAMVRPDTTINRRLFLEDYTSEELFYPKLQTDDVVEKLRGSPVVVFSNLANDQYMLAYQYEGNTKNAFSSFEIGYMKDLEPLVQKKANRLSEKDFKTESGLSLGLSLEDVVKTKGDNFKISDTGDRTTLSYRIEDVPSSPFLKRYSMPGYFIEVVFKQNKVVKILFGFDYP